MNWRDDPKRFHPRGYPRTEVELGWIGDGEVHGQPGDDGLLAPHGRPAHEAWTPFEGFPSNRRAAEVLVGYVKTWLKEERLESGGHSR